MCLNCAGLQPRKRSVVQSSLPSTRPRHKGSTLRWVLLGGIGIFGCLVFLAESGVVAVETSQAKSEADGRYAFTRIGPRSGANALQQLSLTPTVVVNVPAGAGHELAKEVAAAIKDMSGGGGPEQSDVQITITQVTLDGAPWVPFYKSGSCRFVASYRLTAGSPWSSLAAHGQVSGSVTQTMTGLCSTGRFREKLGQAIAAEILGHISRMVAKRA